MTYVLLLTGDLENRELLEAINTYNARNGGTAFPIFLPDLAHPKAFSRLSFQVYHLLRRKNRGSTFHSSSEDTHFQQSAFTIVSAPEDSKVSFALRWPAPVLDIIEGERTLHIAYRLDNATKSAFVWCMDECGQAWRRHEWQFESTEMGVQDVWAFAMVFTGMANVHWRLVIVRYGDLTYPEVQGEQHDPSLKMAADPGLQHGIAYSSKNQNPLQEPLRQNSSRVGLDMKLPTTPRSSTARGSNYSLVVSACSLAIPNRRGWRHYAAPQYSAHQYPTVCSLPRQTCISYCACRPHRLASCVPTPKCSSGSPISLKACAIWASIAGFSTIIRLGRRICMPSI